jgi:hypothetical protein
METTQLVESSVEESQTKTETAEQRRLYELAVNAIEKARDRYGVRSKEVVDEKLRSLAAERPVTFDANDRGILAELILAYEPVPADVSEALGVDGYDELYTSAFSYARP